MSVWTKDPGSEVVDFTLDWDADGELGSGETISTSTWTITPSGEVTSPGDSFENTGKTATVQLDGGTAGKTYDLENKITTSEGRTLVRHRTLRVMDLPA